MFYISKDNLCFVRNVVYQITCNECHQSHIGSTIRRTHDRIKKHLSRSTSSVYKHFASSHDLENLENRISVKIVARETDPVNLRLKEAFYIRKQKAEINSSEECSELTDLLFWSHLLFILYFILHNLYFRLSCTHTTPCLLSRSTDDVVVQRNPFSF